MKAAAPVALHQAVFTRMPRVDEDATSPSLLRIARMGAYLSNRSIRKLHASGIRTLGEAAALGSDGLARMPGLGVKGLREILACLRTHCVECS